MISILCALKLTATFRQNQNNYIMMLQTIFTEHSPNPTVDRQMVRCIIRSAPVTAACFNHPFIVLEVFNFCYLLQ